MTPATSSVSVTSSTPAAHSEPSAPATPATPGAPVTPPAPAASAPPSPRIPLPRVLIAAVISIALGMGLVFLLRTLAVSALGLPQFGPLSVATPLIFSGVLLALGALVFVVLSRTSAKPVSVYRSVALIALLVSFVPLGLRIASPTSLPAFMNGFGGGGGNFAGRQGGRNGNGAAGSNGQQADGQRANAGNNGATTGGGNASGDTGQNGASGTTGGNGGNGQRGNRQRGAGGGLNGILVNGTLALMHVAAYGASVGVMSTLSPRKRKKP